ncbi:MAG: glycosyltransferase [Bacteroidetes bacterium]|nr:MAG: glycosyltransferase [Bacteroidota bacterium]
MLSVLIPVYNFDVTGLVNDLLHQLKSENLHFEILLYDDFSTDLQIKPLLKKLENDYVRVKFLPENIGRSRIRNLMALNARFNNLLFLDCDSKIIRSDFISRYIQNKDKPVVYGGRRYPETVYSDEFLLHYQYGVQRESVNLNYRRKNPYVTFQSNNFMVHKQVFMDIKMDESLTQYGYEDLLFALHLEKRDIPVYHIDNEVEHADLCTNEIFLEKQRQAAENLAFLYSHQKIDNTVRLIDFYERHFFITKLLTKMPVSYIKKKLLANPSNLKWLDLYKLKWFSTALENIEKQSDNKG